MEYVILSSFSIREEEFDRSLCLISLCNRYSSDDEGMLATLAHYTAALLALVKTKGNQFRVLVHPIVPVIWCLLLTNYDDV